MIKELGRRNTKRTKIGNYGMRKAEQERVAHRAERIELETPQWKVEADQKDCGNDVVQSDFNYPSSDLCFQSSDLCSRRHGCSACRFAFDDIMKRLYTLPLDDMNPGHTLIQCFKGRFHFCQHAAFNDALGNEGLRFLNG